MKEEANREGRSESSSRNPQASPRVPEVRLDLVDRHPLMSSRSPQASPRVPEVRLELVDRRPLMDP